MFYTTQFESSLSAQEIIFLKKQILDALSEAAKNNIYEAFYYLGCFYLEEKNGDLRDFEKAFYYLNLAAAYSHGLALYKLYELLFSKQAQLRITSESALLIETANKQENVLFEKSCRRGQRGGTVRLWNGTG